MRRSNLYVLLLMAACGDDGATPVDAPPTPIDAPPGMCQTQGAIGQFIRRAPNPKTLSPALGAAFSDGKMDIHLADPDVHWDGSTWGAYWAAKHGTSYTSNDLVPVIRRATSTDRMTWTIDDAPSLIASTDATAWDRVDTEAPTVVFNPNAPADRRYLMLYAGSDGPFPHAAHSFANYQIGAAFSADGKTFTRIPAAMSPHGKDGLVLTGEQVYPAGSDGIVADPELVLVNGVYHLYFSSFSCSGTDCATVQTFGVAHAYSGDGITWTVEEAPIRSLLRTSALTSGGQQPSVIYDADRCKWEMWLRSDNTGDTSAQPVSFNNMAGVYRAESTDGENWSVNFAFQRDFAWLSNEAGEELGLRTGADVAANGTGRLMLYVGFDDDNVPTDFALPLRAGGTTPGVFTLNVATRDLP